MARTALGKLAEADEWHKRAVSTRKQGDIESAARMEERAKDLRKKALKRPKRGSKGRLNVPKAFRG